MALTHAGMGSLTSVSSASGTWARRSAVPAAGRRSATFTLKPGWLPLSGTRALIIWGSTLAMFLLVGLILASLSGRGVGPAGDTLIKCFYGLPLLWAYFIWLASDWICLQEDAIVRVDSRGVTLPGFLLAHDTRQLVPAAEIMSFWGGRNQHTKQLESIHLELGNGRRLTFHSQSFSQPLESLWQAVGELLPASSPFRSARPPVVNGQFLKQAGIMFAGGLVMVWLFTRGL